MRWLLLLLLGTLGTGSVRAESLALRADDWCPHTCVPGSGPASGDGYLVDLVRAALPRHAMSYQLENWARLRERRSAPPEPVLVVLGLGSSERTTARYRLNREPLGHSPYCFYKRPGLGAWRYQGPASLKGLHLGVTHGYEFDDRAFQAFLNRPRAEAWITRVTGAQAVERHADMLLTGRSDVVLEDREAMRWAFRQRGALGALHEAGCLADGTALHVGVPRSDPRAAATLAELEAGLQRLRRNGDWARIRSRYGLPPA